jgi:hypothetical protein
MKLESNPMIHPRHLLPNVDSLSNFYKRNESIQSRLDAIYHSLEYLKQRSEEEYALDEQEEQEEPSTIKTISFKTATIIVIVAHLLFGGYLMLPKPAKHKPQTTEQRK